MIKKIVVILYTCGFQNKMLSNLTYVLIFLPRKCARSSRQEVFCKKGILTLGSLYYVINWPIWRSSRPEVFCKKNVLRNFTKFTGKHLRQSCRPNKVAGLKSVALLKKRLWDRFFPVNFAKFLRTPFLVEHLWWLLLGPFLLCQWMWYFSRNRMNLGWI